MPDDRATADAFDLKRLPDAFYDDPYPTYRALREHAPVKCMPDGSVFLSRYADVVAVYKDAALHTRVRRLIAGALTPRHIAAMEERLTERVDHLLDAIAARGRGAE